MAHDFTLDDFRRLLNQISGTPGLSAMVAEEKHAESTLRRIRGMIDAMTDEERKDPYLITSSSVSRIAASSGTQPHDVEEFLAQFHQVRALMREIKR